MPLFVLTSTTVSCLITVPCLGTLHSIIVDETTDIMDPDRALWPKEITVSVLWNPSPTSLTKDPPIALPLEGEIFDTRTTGLYSKSTGCPASVRCKVSTSSRSNHRRTLPGDALGGDAQRTRPSTVTIAFALLDPNSHTMS